MPPTPKQAIYQSLLNNPAVAAVVGAKIYPDQAKEKATEPYLEYQVVSDFQKKGLRGRVGTRRVRFQLAAYCATRLQAQQLQAALTAIYDGVANVTFGAVDGQGGLLVAGSFVGTGEDDEGAVDSDEPPRPGEDSGLREVRMEVLWLIP